MSPMSTYKSKGTYMKRCNPQKENQYSVVKEHYVSFFNDATL